MMIRDVTKYMKHKTGVSGANHLLGDVVGVVVVHAVVELDGLVLFVLLLALLAVGEAQTQLDGGRVAGHLRVAVHQLHLDAAVLAKEVEQQQVLHRVAVLLASVDAAQDDVFDLHTLHLLERLRFDALQRNMQP